MRNYKDLQVWQKAHTLTLMIYKGTQRFPIEERYGLTSQIRRACASVPANLAEGCGRRSEGEMARFIQIAMGSGRGAFLSIADYTNLDSELSAVMRMLSALSQKIRTSLAS
jgi:four helix bundle protein